MLSVMTLRDEKEGMMGHSAWHLEFLRDLAEAAEQNQEKESLTKAVANGSIE